MRPIFAGLLLTLLIAAPASGGKLLKYTDAQGKAHYTDSLSKIPRKYRNQITQLRSGPGPSDAYRLPQISNEEILQALKEGKTQPEVLPGPVPPPKKCDEIERLPKTEQMGKEAEVCLEKIQQFREATQQHLNRWQEFQIWNEKRRRAQQKP